MIPKRGKKRRRVPQINLLSESANESSRHFFETNFHVHLNLVLLLRTS